MTAPAEHVATLTAKAPGTVVSMSCSCGVSVVGELLPFAAATRIMLEHLNGGRVAAPAPITYPPGARAGDVSPLGFPDR